MTGNAGFDPTPWKEQFAEMIRESVLRSRNEERLNHWEQVIQRAADAAADFAIQRVTNEERIEELADAARKGATFAAISRDIDAMSAVMADDIKPMVDEFVELFTKIVAEATQDAIAGLLRERISKMLGEDDEEGE